VRTFFLRDHLPSGWDAYPTDFLSDKLLFCFDRGGGVLSGNVTSHESDTKVKYIYYRQGYFCDGTRQDTVPEALERMQTGTAFRNPFFLTSVLQVWRVLLFHRYSFRVAHFVQFFKSKPPALRPNSVSLCVSEPILFRSAFRHQFCFALRFGTNFVSLCVSEPISVGKYL
jgi:hypothetical protein